MAEVTKVKEGVSERQMQGERESRGGGGMNSTFSSVFATGQTDGHSDKERKEGEGE